MSERGERVGVRVAGAALGWIVTVCVPVFMLLVSLQAVTSHRFVRWLYTRPAFPPDPYGLTTQQRIALAEVCVDYLRSDGDIVLLAELRLPGGDLAFNERELDHMIDVQRVFHQVIVAGAAAGFVAVAGPLAIWAIARSRRRAARALLRGGWVTIGLLLAVGAYMALSWQSFFTRFHQVFFDSGTWLFDYSDTLIRLFPIRFWIAVALAIVALLFVQAMLLAATVWGLCLRQRTPA